MSEKEKSRLEVIQAIMDHRVTMSQASTYLKLSERQLFRILKRVREEGIQGIRHKNKGRASPRRTPQKLRDKILSLANGPLKDINDTHMRELLDTNYGISIGRETLRSLLRTNGIPPKRKHRSSRYRSRREPKPAFGAMLQIDASIHPWLQDRGPKLTLIGAIDDATNYVWARFDTAETTWAYLDLMQDIISSHGIPISLYSDRHTIFHSPREPTIEEQLNGSKPLTQFGRAMDELGISLIKAYSPQAKGKIERLWGTFQDRLTVQLRLANAKNIHQANQVLEQFLKDFNQRFTREPKSASKLFRKPPNQSTLKRILCIKNSRVVAKDHTISFESLILQIPPLKKFSSLPGKKVTVLQLKDASIEISHKSKIIARFPPDAVTNLIKKHSSNSNLRSVA